MSHYAYDFFPRRAATALAFQGLLGAVLLWYMRGPRSGLLWPVCLLGVAEGLQLFGCQLALNWRAMPEVARFSGVCDAFSGLPLYAWGLVALVWLAAWIHDKKETHHGD